MAAGRVLGCLLLPLSFFGLFSGGGILGLSPFLTVFVYRRAAAWALNSAQHLGTRAGPAFLALWGAVFVVGVALLSAAFISPFWRPPSRRPRPGSCSGKSSCSSTRLFSPLLRGTHSGATVCRDTLRARDVR